MNINPVLLDKFPREIREELTKQNVQTDLDIYNYLKKSPLRLIDFIERSYEPLLLDRAFKPIAAKCFRRLNKLFIQRKIDRADIQEICNKINHHPRTSSLIPCHPSLFNNFAPIIESLQVGKIVPRLTDLARASLVVTPENVLDAAVYSHDNQYENLYRKTVSYISHNIHDHNVLDLYTFAKENALIEIQNACVDYLLDRVSETLSDLATSKKTRELIEFIKASLVPQKDKKKKRAISRAITWMAQPLLKRSPTDILRLAMPILKEHRLPSERLEQFEPKKLIALFHTIPESFHRLSFKRYSNGEVRRMIPHFPKGLRSLDLGRVALENESLKALSSRCSIEELSFNITYKSLETLQLPFSEQWSALHQFRNLRRLEAINCVDLSVADIECLLSGSPDLEILKLGMSGKLDPLSERHEYQTQYARLCEEEKGERKELYRKFPNYGNFIIYLVNTYCKKLKELDLNNLNITDIHKLKKENLERVEIINLSNCRKLSSKNLISFIQSCPNLKSLDLSEMPSVVSDFVLVSIAPYLPNLEELNLNGNLCSGKAIIELAYHCPHLKSLRVKYCQISEDELVNVGEFCPKLETLAVWKTFTDKGLMTLLRQHQFLELDVEGCASLTEASFNALKKQDGLQCLSLSENDNVSDDSIASLLHHLPDLKQLVLMKFKNIGRQTLEALATCVDLELLNFDYSPIGDSLASQHVCLENVVLKKLRALYLRQTKLHSDLVVKLVRCFPYLEILDLGQEKRKFIGSMIPLIRRIRSLEINGDNINSLLKKNPLPCLEKFICNGFVYTERNIRNLFLGSPRLRLFYNKFVIKQEYPIFKALSEESKKKILEVRKKRIDRQKRHPHELAPDKPCPD